MLRNGLAAFLSTNTDLKRSFKTFEELKAKAELVIDIYNSISLYWVLNLDVPC